MFTPLINYIKSIVPLTNVEEHEVSKCLCLKKVSRGEHLVQENQVCNDLVFITKGFFRLFIMNNGDEVTIHLESSGHFITAFQSFISRSPSNEYLHAVTDAEIVTINYENLQKLYKQSHNIERLGRLMVEKHFLGKEQRVISFIRESAEERYKNLMQKRPEFLLNLPLQHIASYLGMKPETLSRIRSKGIF